jgi:SpoVK/Ycf46/Vps4 family AAA+-type ATPase
MGAILTFMQESAAPIFWLFTANRVDGLPPELLRKGRLDEVFAVLPPNAVERLEIMRIHLKARKQNPDAIADLADAVANSEGYVSAELEAAVKEAVIESFHSHQPITGAALVRQLKNMKPISIAFADDFNAMRQWAENNARLASTPEAPMEGKSLVQVMGAVRPVRRRRIG